MLARTIIDISKLDLNDTSKLDEEFRRDHGQEATRSDPEEAREEADGPTAPAGPESSPA